MCTIIQKFANTGLVNIATANTDLSGMTGPWGTVLTSSTLCNGTNISSVTIKATSTTTQGMVRLFIQTGSTIQLIKEIPIPANTSTSYVPPFQVTLYEEITLDPQQMLLASTQNSESFNVFANGTDWYNCTCSNACNCNEETVVYNSGMATSDSSTPITVLTAITASALANGTRIPCIDIKGASTGSIGQGLVSLYINNGSSDFLIWDVPVPAFTQSTVEPTYRTRYMAMIDLQAGYLLKASNNMSSAFNVIAFASDVTNCPC